MSWAEKRRRATAAAPAAAPAAPVPVPRPGPGEFQLTFFKQHREYFRASMFALAAPACSVQGPASRPLVPRVPPLSLPQEDFPEVLWSDEYAQQNKKRFKGANGAFKPNLSGGKNKRLLKLCKFLEEEVDKLDSDESKPLNRIKAENEGNNTKTPLKNKIQKLEDMLRAPKKEESTEDYDERMSKLDTEKRKAMEVSRDIKLNLDTSMKEEDESEDEEVIEDEEEEEGAEYEDEGDYGKNYYDSDDGMGGGDDDDADYD